MAGSLLGRKPRSVTPFAQLRLRPQPRLHQGADIGVPAGTTVHAIAAGVVVRADEIDARGYGSVMVIEHHISGQVLDSVYAHLSRRDFKVGASVQTGQVIGLTGGEVGAPGAGDSAAPHLHFEIAFGPYKGTLKAAESGGPPRLDPIAFLIQNGIALGGGVVARSNMTINLADQSRLLAAAKQGDTSRGGFPGKVLV